MIDLTQYIELGGIAGLFALFIVQYFQYAKQKKDPMNGTGKMILQELQTQNNNHLEHIEDGINDGFKNMGNKQDNCANRICEKLDTLIIAIVELKGMMKR
jgi:hypothetical protein